jgi:hypothetical protein
MEKESSMVKGEGFSGFSVVYKEIVFPALKSFDPNKK